MESILPKDAPKGIVFLAFLGNADLPSYKLVIREGNRWSIEGGVAIKQAMITDLWILPFPTSLQDAA